MDKIALDKRNIGLNFGPAGEASMLFWAPYARKVEIEVNGKTRIPLVKKVRGYWQAVLDGVKPGDLYSVVLNGKTRYPDPATPLQADGVHKASTAFDFSTLRKDSQWKGIPLEKLIIYELHVGTFTPAGTFDAIHDKLPYLKELGINAVEIMPVAQFPGERNWGYDGVLPFAVQHSYGGAEGLAGLVEACHNHGIAVILDVVYNHMGPEGNYLEKFGPYFTGKYKTPWGKAINFDDEYSDEVRRFFIENALMWFRDFNIDGLRLDAVHAIKDMGPKHFLKELKEYTALLNKQTGKNHFLIGECDLNDVKYINPVDQCGYGLNSQWCDEFHHALHALLTGERNGYYADFGDLDLFVKSLNQAYVYDGNYSAHRKKYFGTKTKGQPGHRFVVFSQNHDQVGNRMLGERLSQLLDFETLKLAATTMFFNPFIPMLFMGEEYGEENPFLFFVHHGDEHLVEMTQKGRKREFRDFYKKGSPPDPQAEETFIRSKLDWDFEKDPQKKSMLAFYKKLIGLRKNHPLMANMKREKFKARRVEGHEAISLLFQDERGLLMGILNFSENPLEISLPEFAGKQPEVLLNSSASQWGGENNHEQHKLKKQSSGELLAELAPKSALILAG